MVFNKLASLSEFVDYYNFLNSVGLLRVELIYNISHIHCLQGIFPGRIFWYPMRIVLWLKNHPYTVTFQDFIFYISYLLYSDFLKNNFLCTLSYKFASMCKFSDLLAQTSGWNLSPAHTLIELLLYVCCLVHLWSLISDYNFSHHMLNHLCESSYVLLSMTSNPKISHIHWTHNIF